MKNLLKILSTITVFSLLLAVAPAVLAETSTTTVSTGLTRDTTGGASPIVKAKWEAHPDRYTDDDVAADAQLLPSGQYNVHTTIAFCAVVTDPDALSDIDNVYFDFFYPEFALGPSHVPIGNQSGLGCGEEMQEDRLSRLSKADGIALFCDSVRNLNNNLPTFNSSPIQYDYNEICATDGELQKETAAVYCGEKEISYEDPSGDYTVLAIGQDKNGLQGTLENSFEYLPVTAFETDFTSVSYGSVRLNTHKIISGNLTWGDSKASVRNIGNTRLSMRVLQDDMGFGKTNGNWNVIYDGRVGSDASFVNYYPDTLTTLPLPLNLSELDEMDFSIDVSKFPPTHISDTYTGNIWLSAIPEDHLDCLETETGTVECHDGIDNDGDGDIDSADSDCEL